MPLSFGMRARRSPEFDSVFRSSSRWQALLEPDLIQGFEFDVGNLLHLLNRHIEPADVWEVFYSDPVFIEDRSGGSGDWLMIAPIPGGWLTIVLTEPNSGDPRMARPITGWSSERWEVEEYERHTP